MTAKRIGLIAAVLGTVAVALGFFWPFRTKAQGLHLFGVVEIQEVRLGSKVGGRVEEVHVSEGQLVEPGRILVQFEAPELQWQSQQAKAQLDLANAQYEKAKAGPRQEEKDEARAAAQAAQARWELLVEGPRDEEIRKARSELQMAEADLKWAKEEFDRSERLLASGAERRADYDAARAAYERNRNRTAASRAQLDVFLAGSRVEDIRAAAAEMSRAEAKLRLLEAGTRSEEKDEAAARVAEAYARLREIETSLAEREVRAPERAVVEVLAVRKGDLVPPNQPVIKVLRAADLWVRVYVPETELGKVRLNQRAEVTVDAYPDRKLEGTVIQIASESEFTPRNVQSKDERRHQVFGLKIRVPDPEGIFKSGMAADVWLPLEE